MYCITHYLHTGIKPQAPHIIPPSPPLNPGTSKTDTDDLPDFETLAARFASLKKP